MQKDNNNNNNKNKDRSPSTSYAVDEFHGNIAVHSPVGSAWTRRLQTCVLTFARDSTRTRVFFKYYYRDTCERNLAVKREKFAHNGRVNQRNRRPRAV